MSQTHNLEMLSFTRIKSNSKIDTTVADKHGNDKNEENKNKIQNAAKNSTDTQRELEGIFDSHVNEEDNKIDKHELKDNEMDIHYDKSEFREFHTVAFGVVGMLDDDKIQNMDKAQLLDIHKMQLLRKENNIANTEKLVKCLGGIDNILTLILSCKDIEIENKEIAEIHRIITEKSSKEFEDDYKQNNRRHNLIKHDNNNNDHQHGEHGEHGGHAAWCTYYFNCDCTYLHSLFGDKNAENILNKIYSKYSKITTLLILFMIILTMPPVPIIKGDVYWLITRTITGVWGSILLTLSLLSANQRCFGLIKSQFEFWLKLIYMLQRTILFLVYNYYIKSVTNERNISIGFLLLKDIVIQYCLIVYLIIISSVDAFKGKSFMKLIAGISLGLLLTKDAIYFSFFSYFGNENDSTINMKYIGSISIIALYGATNQILAIFVWKQMMNVIIKRGKCKLIKHSPDIKWIHVCDDHNNDHTKQIDDGVDCGCLDR